MGSGIWRFIFSEAEGVYRASDAAAAGAVQHVGVDHRRVDMLVAEELLDCPDVVTVLDQVGREGVAERVAVDRPLDSRAEDGFSHRTLDDPLVDVVAADGIRAGIG